MLKIKFNKKKSWKWYIYNYNEKEINSKRREIKCYEIEKIGVIETIVANSSLSRNDSVRKNRKSTAIKIRRTLIIKTKISWKLGKVNLKWIILRWNKKLQE